MTRRCPVRALSLAIVLWACLSTGCSGKKTATVKGTLLQAGQPLKATKKTLVTISFSPVDTSVGQSYPAKFKWDEGTYTITLPAGQYTAGVTMVPEGKPLVSAPAGKAYDITQDMTIDLELP